MSALTFGEGRGGLHDEFAEFAEKPDLSRVQPI